jgi:hypothetical protein
MDERAATYDDVIIAARNIKNFDDLLKARKRCNISMRLFLGLTAIASPYSLEVVNALFEYAKTSQDEGMAYLVLLRIHYDELIAASNGKLFWAEDEHAARVELFRLAKNIPDIPSAVIKLDNAFIRLHNRDHEGMWPYEGLLMECLNWLTTDVPASTIKPAKR